MRKITLAIVMMLTTLLSAQNTVNHNLEVAKQMEIFSTLYRYLDLMYVDTLNAEQVVGEGIKGMLNSLDPYTEYYPAADRKELKSMITGKYGGIGAIITYRSKDKRSVISEPYFGMPAYEAGLRMGDIILAIDGEDMTNKQLSYVTEHLRGNAGTSFLLKYQRPGLKEPATAKITRRQIQMPAIPYYGMANDSVGFISFSQFTEDCAKVFRNAVIDLKRQGMSSLIIDLRANTGGSLSEAVDILNLFLPKDMTLVRTRGKLPQSGREYTTSKLPIDTVMPIVALVGNMTASASEIMSGTLQDLDRGVIMGTKTYGKGLVQTPIALPYNGNLKLTTAHYYIPSGRCVQAIKYKRGNNEVVADSLKREFKTKNGRTVKDGGGIMPDIVITPDTIPNVVYYFNSALDSTSVLMDYVVDYVASHKTIAPARDFEISDEDYEDFKKKAIESGFQYDRESSKLLKQLKKVAEFEGYYNRAKAEFDALEKKLAHDLSVELDHNKQEVKQAISSDIVACYYYQTGVIENSLRSDKLVQEALSLLADKSRYHKLLYPEQKK